MMWCKYEDLVGRKMQTVASIAAFVGVPEDEALFEKVG